MLFPHKFLIQLNNNQTTSLNSVLKHICERQKNHKSENNQYETANMETKYDNWALTALCHQNVHKNTKLICPKGLSILWKSVLTIF